MSLLTSRNINWREATERYFETMNPWLSVVHPDLFAIRTEGMDPMGTSGPSSSMGNPTPTTPGLGDPALALLIVCMQLVSQYDGESSSDVLATRRMIELPAYMAAKRVFSVLCGTTSPTIILIQCAVLLALFEFGHGDVTRAYITIGDANTMALSMGIRPGKYTDADTDAPVSFEDEERRCVYWSLFVLDRLVHVDCYLIHMPLQVPAPLPDDLLPTTNLVWNNQYPTPTRTIQRHPANVSPSVPLGPFQRNCQCAMLYTSAFAPGQCGPESVIDNFVELDIATRALVEAMVLQASRWGDFYECFATCTCLLLFLYCRQLKALSSPSNLANPQADTDLAPKAIAGLNFAVRIIADTTTDLNDQFARSPHLLSPCSPITPYSAYHCLMVLSHFEHLIPDADVRFHAIYSSLHFFAKRWAIAGLLVKSVEKNLSEDDDSPDWCFMKD